MKDIYVDLRGLEIEELFKDKDFVSIEELIEVFTGVYLDSKNKEEELEDLKEYKDNCINSVETNLYSYYGVSDTDFR